MAPYRAGVNRTYISKLEEGASYPGLEIIAKIATVLEVEPAELLRVPERALPLTIELAILPRPAPALGLRPFGGPPRDALEFARRLGHAVGLPVSRGRLRAA